MGGLTAATTAATLVTADVYDRVIDTLRYTYGGTAYAVPVYKNYRRNVLRYYSVGSNASIHDLVTLLESAGKTVTGNGGGITFSNGDRYVFAEITLD